MKASSVAALFSVVDGQDLNTHRTQTAWELPVQLRPAILQLTKYSEISLYCVVHLSLCLDGLSRVSGSYRVLPWFS